MSKAILNIEAYKSAETAPDISVTGSAAGSGDMEPAAWAHVVPNADNALVLKSESTGLGPDAEYVQVAIMTVRGTTIMSTFLRPSRPIPPAATAVNGIDDAAVVNAPTFVQAYKDLVKAIQGRVVVAYNAEFEQRMLVQTCLHYRLPVPQATWHCAMRAYAEMVGEESPSGSYLWQPLPRLQARQGEGRALTGCRSILELLKSMSLCRGARQ
ncbi:MAG: 3'-5' exonuclease [Chloroflexota bacterium]